MKLPLPREDPYDIDRRSTEDAVRSSHVAALEAAHERAMKVVEAARRLLLHDDAADERSSLEPCFEAEWLREALREFEAEESKP